MKAKAISLFIFLCSCTTTHAQQYNTAKPWAYWWWLGSAVSEEGIKQNLQDYAKAGFGGMHIIPIYGVKGEETKFIPYLSPQWLNMLNYTLKEAKKLGLGIDMTLGTGWPLGGSYVKPEDAAWTLKFTKEGNSFKISEVNTNQKVKRAAPGGEGLVIDHFSSTALAHYLEPFKNVFEKNKYPVRALYNDSYEVYGANWTPKFDEQFLRFRGYESTAIRSLLAENQDSTEMQKRLWSDYHETLSDIMLEEFTKPLNSFVNSLGKQFRNEAHGSPACILDLYAASDIPESEFFGSKKYAIPLYRQDPDYEENRFGFPDIMVVKLASSAANVSGKKLVSSETSTWLGNHFKVALSQIKPIIDESFLGGINHIFYHGMPYTPLHEPFPGWLFYASTNYNQNSHFWHELPLLNDYITQCQSRLQNAKTDNDVLLYMPIYDLWHTKGTRDNTHPIDVHTIVKKGIFKDGFGTLAKLLVKNGYAFDFVSDKQILDCEIDKEKNIKTKAGIIYQTLVIPACTYFSLKTLQHVEKLSKAGAKIIFEGHLPQKVNGFFEWENRQETFDKVRANLTHLVSENMLLTLNNRQIRHETFVKSGLSFIRKKTLRGQLYFIANLDSTFSEEPIELATSAQSLTFFDPLTKDEKIVSVMPNNAGKIAIPLKLLPGQSIFIETFDYEQGAEPIRMPNSKGYVTYKLNGTWQIEFTKGQPFLPTSIKTDKLVSWTELGDSLAQYYNGYARYTLHFNWSGFSKQTPRPITLDLGDVRETASVKINGVDIGTAWAIPYRLAIPPNILKEKNVIEIEVRNLSANHIRYLDKKGVNWRKFYDINMVDITYKPFNAAQWKPVPSGLLGAVKIIF